MLSNSERTPQVIRNAMIKHDVEGNTDDYVLAQLLPDGGEHRPLGAWVYLGQGTWDLGSETWSLGPESLEFGTWSLRHGI